MDISAHNINRINAEVSEDAEGFGSWVEFTLVEQWRHDASPTESTINMFPAHHSPAFAVRLRRYAEAIEKVNAECDAEEAAATTAEQAA